MLEQRGDCRFSDCSFSALTCIMMLYEPIFSRHMMYSIADLH